MEKALLNISLHIPIKDKVVKLLDQSFSLLDTKAICELEEDIDFVLSRLEMIEDRVKKLINEFILPKDAEEDILRWIRHVKAVIGNRRG